MRLSNHEIDQYLDDEEFGEGDSIDRETAPRGSRKPHKRKRNGDTSIRIPQFDIAKGISDKIYSSVGRSRFEDKDDDEDEDEE